MLNIEEWKKYCASVLERPGDYTAQDKHLAELMLEVIADREAILDDYLLAQAHIRALEHALQDAQSQVSYYRSRA